LSLGRRFVLGSLYLGTGHILTNALNLAIQIAVARLLGPVEFGLYAFCFAINEFINVVGAFSLSFALIQREEATQADYDTALLSCALQGLAGLAVAAAIAPVLGAARSREAAWILMAMALARVLRLLCQVPQARLERHLRYARVTAVTAVAAVVPNLLSLGLAWAGWGAWSLATRDVAAAALLLAGTWVVAGYRYRGQLSRSSWRALMDFARPLFASRALEILMERLDALAIGSFFGNRPIGIYHQARFLSDAGFIASRPVERIGLNLYARVQHDRPRLDRAWDLVNYFLLRVMLAGASALLLFPHEVVELLLGNEWAEVAPLLRWLALYAGLLPVFHNAKNLLYGLGEVRTMLRIRIVQALLFSIAVALAVVLGSAEAMAAGLLATTLASLALAWAWTRRFVTSPPAWRLCVPLLALAVSTAVCALLSFAGTLESVPTLVRPFVAPLVFTAALFGLEGSTPARELRYLRAQLGSSEVATPAGTTDPNERDASAGGQARHTRPTPRDLP